MCICAQDQKLAIYKLWCDHSAQAVMPYTVVICSCEFAVLVGCSVIKTKVLNVYRMAFPHVEHSEVGFTDL